MLSCHVKYVLTIETVTGLLASRDRYQWVTECKQKYVDTAKIEMLSRTRRWFTRLAPKSIKLERAAILSR